MIECFVYDMVFALSGESEQTNAEEGRLDKLKLRVVSATGYLLPLLASFPPLMGWAGLMTLPFALFLLIMAGRLPEIHVSLPYLFFGGNVFDIMLMLSGLGLLIASVAYLRSRKSEGLVASGPYKVVRHPQYFGLILFTAAMTSRSIWMLTHTFGMSWLTTYHTLVVWYAMLLAYIGLALIEELHLSKTHPQEWGSYRERVGFLFPLANSRHRILEVFVPILVLGLMMYGLAVYSTWWT
jgi:protein-S-isoprenylcysteine O-methyltransferase Ste14